MLNSMEDIVKANMDAGHNFLSPQTMRWWKTRRSNKVYPTTGGTFFVTSDVWGDDERYWTVRFCYDSGMIRTVGEKTTSYRAHKLAARCASLSRAISEES